MVWNRNHNLDEGKVQPHVYWFTRHVWEINSSRFIALFASAGNRRDDVGVRAFSLQSVNLGTLPQVQSYQKTFKNGIPSLALQHIGIVWRTSRQALLVVSLGKALSGLHLSSFVEDRDRWRDQAVCPLWWPSLTKHKQTKHELIRMNEKMNGKGLFAENLGCWIVLGLNPGR